MSADTVCDEKVWRAWMYWLAHDSDVTKMGTVNEYVRKVRPSRLSLLWY